MKSVKGDIIQLALAGKLDVLVHACNCWNNMGRGLALQIADRFPAAKQADLATVKGDCRKLGSYTFSIEDNEIGGKFIIVNAYTQYNYGPRDGTVYTSYEYLDKVFTKIGKKAGTKIIAYPKIGADRGGADWIVIHAIINARLANNKHFLVEW